LAYYIGTEMTPRVHVPDVSILFQQCSNERCKMQMEGTWDPETLKENSAS